LPAAGGLNTARSSPARPTPVPEIEWSRAQRPVQITE
jgi:hypothetical protein